KNLIILSFGFMFVFSAFFSLRNLQTSLNRKYSLGLFSLACMNATFAAGCILANTIIQKVRPKRVITLMLFGNSLYVASNFYPSFLTLVPATLILGFTMANLLVAQSTYLTSIAVSFASAANKRPDYIISVFNGYFLFMIYLAHFFGNLMSSIIFYIFPSSLMKTLLITSNVTSVSTQLVLNNFTNESQNCGFKFHFLSVEQMEYNFSIDFYVLYILVAIFMLVTIQAHLIIGLFLDRLDVIFYKSKLGLKSQVCEIWKLHVDPKMKFMLPMMIYLGFQEAFIYADFTNSYVTCSIGLHMIGFVMMTFSAMDSVSSFLCGYLRRFLSQSVMMAVGSVLHLITLLFLYFWKPSPDQRATVFVVAVSLGVVDGIWQTLTNSLCGILFSSRQRVAVFSSLRMYQALGFTIASVYSHFLYNEVKVAILMIVL
ncbi:hypothetical protein HELRODRAFT_121951, partial [Helobdella robusta]|uniref:Major facilitator superfamily associated domain-containing protein n=1 Tax=Helobdella robusta TaxID=6412 RepID=T1EGT3_HELRO